MPAPCSGCGRKVQIRRERLWQARSRATPVWCGPRCERLGKRAGPLPLCQAPVPRGCRWKVRRRGAKLCNAHYKRVLRGQRIDTPVFARGGPDGTPGKCLHCGCRGSCPEGCIWTDQAETECSRCVSAPAQERNA